MLRPCGATHRHTHTELTHTYSETHRAHTHIHVFCLLVYLICFLARFERRSALHGNLHARFVPFAYRDARDELPAPQPLGLSAHSSSHPLPASTCHAFFLLLSCCPSQCGDILKFVFDFDFASSFTRYICVYSPSLCAYLCVCDVVFVQQHCVYSAY